MRRFIRIVSMVLVLTIAMAIPVFAAEQGSDYFMSHSCYLWEVSDSEFQVWFNVTAVDAMDVLGVSEVIVQRSTDGVNWSDEAFYYDMYRYGKSYYSGHVTYSDVTSGYYRAEVTYYAENDNGIAEYTARTSSFHY